MSESIHEHEGRGLFGSDPNNYDTVRPAYPDQVYDFLQTTRALRPNVATLELGAGNGLATRKLLELGADPLTVLEPDTGFSKLLTSLVPPDEGRYQVIQASFEDAELPSQSYDLVAAATSFHWFRPSIRMVKVADVLKPGGYLALWWNVFGDPEREDLFHEATVGILGSLSRSPSDPKDALPFALDTTARVDEIVSTGAFDEPSIELYRWTLWLNTRQVGALYATFSHIIRLPTDQRSTILEQLMEIAEREFGGRVARNMVTPIYVAQRNATNS